MSVCVLKGFSFLCFISSQSIPDMFIASFLSTFYKIEKVISTDYMSWDYTMCLLIPGEKRIFTI